jgi:hypothetical protein
MRLGSFISVMSAAQSRSGAPLSSLTSVKAFVVCDDYDLSNLL